MNCPKDRVLLLFLKLPSYMHDTVNVTDLRQICERAYCVCDGRDTGNAECKVPPILEGTADGNTLQTETHPACRTCKCSDEDKPSLPTQPEQGLDAHGFPVLGDNLVAQPGASRYALNRWPEPQPPPTRDGWARSRPSEESSSSDQSTAGGSGPPQACAITDLSRPGHHRSASSQERGSVVGPPSRRPYPLARHRRPPPRFTRLTCAAQAGGMVGMGSRPWGP